MFEYRVKVDVQTVSGVSNTQSVLQAVVLKALTCDNYYSGPGFEYYPRLHSTSCRLVVKVC